MFANFVKKKIKMSIYFGQLMFFVAAIQIIYVCKLNSLSPYDTSESFLRKWLSKENFQQIMQIT